MKLVHQELIKCQLHDTILNDLKRFLIDTFYGYRNGSSSLKIELGYMLFKFKFGWFQTLFVNNFGFFSAEFKQKSKLWLTEWDVGQYNVGQAFLLKYVFVIVSMHWNSVRSC